MSVQSTRSFDEPSRLGIAFATALALHVGAMTAVALWQSRESVSPPGEQEITIDLAPAMENIESVAPAEVALPAETPMEAQALPPEESASTVAPVETQAVAVEAVPAEEIPPQTEALVALPPPETVVAQPLANEPEPKPEKPAPKPVERKPAPPKPVDTKPRATAERRAPPSNPQRGQASASRENTGGSAASADPNALNRYAALLASTLRGRLTYPREASNQGILGTAIVRFTMDRSGRITGASLVRSAGNPLLDQAALATARPGSSLPAAPDAVPQQQFTFSIPLRFDLR